MASRALTDLHPSIQADARALVAAWKTAGLTILVTCTLRSLEEQARLYAQGRTAPGPVVTKARPGRSWHNFGLALDLVPLREGKAVWRSTDPLWSAALDVARGQGWTCGADWPAFPDLPHVQRVPRGLTLATAREQVAAHGGALPEAWTA